MSAPQRISVVGSSGAGKSTLARALGERLGLPVIHLDRHFWRPGWVETPKTEWAEVHRELAGRERWIIDGNYSGTMRERLARSDRAVHLDLPSGLCLLSVVRRALRHLGRVRPDLGPGCPEKLPDLEFLEFVRTFPVRYRPTVVTELARFEAGGGRVIRLRTRRAARAFLDRVPRV